MKILIFGRNGWIANQFFDFFKDKEVEVIKSQTDITDKQAVESELKQHNPEEDLNPNLTSESWPLLFAYKLVKRQRPDFPSPRPFLRSKETFEPGYPEGNGLACNETSRISSTWTQGLRS